MPNDEAGARQNAAAPDDLVNAGQCDPAATGIESPEPFASDFEATRPEPNAAKLGNENATAIRPIEDLMLSELIERWLRMPKQTWRALRIAMIAAPTSAPIDRETRFRSTLAPSVTNDLGSATFTSIRALPRRLRQVTTVQLLLYGIAIICALTGSVMVRGSDNVPRAGGYSLSVGAPYLWLGFLLWLAAEVVGQWAQVKDYWRSIDRSARLRWAARALPISIWINALFTLAASMTAPPESATAIALAALSWFVAGGLLWILIEFAYWQVRQRSGTNTGGEPRYLDRQPARRPISAEISQLRKLIIALATLSSLVVWTNTTGNRIQTPIIALWLVSAALWGFVFAPLRWNVFDWASGRIDVIRRLRWRDHRWTIIALILIMLLGAGFRFNKLDTHPPQMYSDLVEKIQDAYKVHHLNDYRIFFDNIGGREPVHFYLLSILASQPGMEFNHYALKFMSALESFVTLPIVFWLGVEVVGKRRRQFGLLFGLLAAGLVAVSFWHAAIGRQGMRISLAPLFSALTAVYLVRALRYNRRSDYVKAGMALGFGLMGYQAVRMLPVAAVAGVAIAVVLVRHSWRTRLSYFLNLAVLAFVSFMVFLPLFHYWTEEPEDYMRRANTRLFGDMPTTGYERAAFLLDSVPVLMSNISKTSLIYHYYGDSTWVSAVGDEPAMDPLTAAFMVLGIAAWLTLIVKTREPVFIFVPVYLFATLLPTALALSFPIEVPSFIRASGAIPPSYLIAALPVAVFCRHLCKTITGRLGTVVAAVFAVGVLLAANHYNANLYFGEFTDNFVRASHPQAQAGQILRGFAESDGAYGNAFVLTSAHWWDVRAVGIEAGVMFWDSGGNASTVPQLMERGLRREELYRLDPERDLLFFYSRQNEAAPQLLTEWFPNGRQMEVEVQPSHKSFYIYRAPAMGADGLQRFLDENA